MKTVLDVLDETFKYLEEMQKVNDSNHALMNLKFERMKAEIYAQIREEKSREDQMFKDLEAIYHVPKEGEAA